MKGERKMEKYYPQRYKDIIEILKANGWKESSEKSFYGDWHGGIVWEKEEYPYQINFYIQSNICDVSVFLNKGETFLETDFFLIGTCHYQKEDNRLSFGGIEESSENAVAIAL